MHTKNMSKVYPVKKWGKKVGICGYDKKKTCWRFIGGGSTFGYESKERMLEDFNEKEWKAEGIND